MKSHGSIVRCQLYLLRPISKNNMKYCNSAQAILIFELTLGDVLFIWWKYPIACSTQQSTRCWIQSKIHQFLLLTPELPENLLCARSNILRRSLGYSGRGKAGIFCSSVGKFSLDSTHSSSIYILAGPASNSHWEDVPQLARKMPSLQLEKIYLNYCILAGTSTDATNLHPVHPHLAQDPLTGQTLLISSVSPPIHTEQICKLLHIHYFDYHSCV